jgi:hypothetical protein
MSGGGFESAESSGEIEVRTTNGGGGDSRQTQFTCDICLDNVAGTPWALSCGHAYCRECIESHVKTLVAIGDVYRVNCPSPTCRRPLSVRDVEFVCCADVAASYRREKARIDALRTRDVVPCATPDCRGQLAAKHQRLLTMRHCDVCGRDTCLKCMEQHPLAAKCDVAGGTDWKVCFVRFVSFLLFNPVFLFYFIVHSP